MALKRLDPQDFVVSSDSISATLWSGGTPTLTTFFTSSTQEAGSSGNYYLNIYQTASTDSNAAIQFAVVYGNKDGSGSIYYNSAVTGVSPTKTIYGQYRTLVLGDENSSFIFGNQSSSDFWALSIDRARYKESIFPGSLTLKLSGSLGVISLTDDSQVVASTTFTDAGRVYNLISGSAGSKVTTTATTGIGLNVSRSLNAPGLNNRRIFQAISASTAATFKLNSQETISSDYIFIRARNAEFNYTENPSFISGSTGEVVYDEFILNPQTYITTVGLYNDTNDLVAVAKMSRPLLKDFTKEALVRIKLDF